MKRLLKFWPFILIGFIVLIFFAPIFKGNIPFPGDLLVSSNPYSAESYLGYQPGGYPNKAQGPDVITEIYPWRHFSIEQLKQGTIPFWNPYNFSGNPQLANFQTAIFYPVNLIYFLLPFNVSWTLIIMLQPLLAGIFMFLFLRKGLGLSDFASFIGGISFAFCSYMTVWIQYGNIGSTFLWLPLALLFTKRFFNRPSNFNFLSLVLIFSVSILAGYIQGVFYIYVLSFFYYTFLLLSKKDSFKNHKKNILFLLSFLIPLFLTAFQILPTLGIFSESTRAAYTLTQIENNLAPFFYWVTILAPDFFGNPATRNYWIDGTYIERVMYPGSLILSFVVFTLLSKISVSEKRFFTLSALVSLVLATNLPFVKYFYLIPIPVISTTVPTRELSIFIFSLIVLGAIGIDYLFSNKNFKKFPFFLNFAAYLVITIAVLAVIQLIPDLSLNLKISLRNLIIPSSIAFLVIVSLYLKKVNLKITYLLLLFLVIFDLFYFFNKITPFSPSSFTYPQTKLITKIKETSGINRFWGYGSAYMLPNFQTVDQVYSTEGNDPLHISRYAELLQSSVDGKFPKSLPRPDANIAFGYGPDDLRNNIYRKRILDLLGVKYIIHKQDLKDAFQSPDLTTFPVNDYELKDKIYPWQIYENKSALPRFFLVSDYLIAKDKKEALSFIYNKDIDLSKTLVLEEQPKLKLGASATGEAKLVSYKPNKVIIKTFSSLDSILFLSDSYYKEWEVKVDSLNSRILIANYAFRAVEVPKGEHTIEFFYQPKSFNFGLGTSALGVIILVFLLYYVKNNKNKF